MDSLRKKPSVAQKTEIGSKNSNSVQSQEKPIPSYQKREELYISQEETNWRKKDKKFPPKRKRIGKIIGIFFLLLLLAALSWAAFFLWKTHNVSKKMNTSSQSNQATLAQNVQSLITPASDKKSSLQGEESGRINILLLGAAGENQPGGNLTDTVMVMSIDSKNKKLALLSLPRDFYAPVGKNSNSLPAGRQGFTKINSLYKIGLNEQVGTDLIKQAVEKITGIELHYHVVVDFAAFEKIIDDLGGVNVMVARDIYDSRYPGPNYSYQTFSLNKGAHLLDGPTALKYVRQRHDDPEGDFGRAKRQQQVIQAVKSKLFSAQTLFNVVALSRVLDTLGDNIKTNISFDDIDQFIKLSRTLDTQNITNVVIDAWKPESLLKVSHVEMGGVRAFILIPRVGNYSEIQELSRNIFDQTELKKRQASIITEDASITLINQSGSEELGSKIKKLLSEKLGFKNIQTLSGGDEIISNSTISTNETGSEKIFTLDELIKKLPATLEPQKNNSTDDITIKLGQDLIETYKFEEDSMDDLNRNQDNQEYIDFTKVSK